MTEGDVVLTPLPQADGAVKNRPALFLRDLPPFRDLLVCGISTQLGVAVPDFDEIVRRSDDDFAASGLVSDSVIRLGFLAVIPRARVVGAIGAVSRDRHERLLVKLSEYLVAPVRRGTPGAGG